MPTKEVKYDESVRAYLREKQAKYRAKLKVEKLASSATNTEADGNSKSPAKSLGELHNVLL